MKQIAASTVKPARGFTLVETLMVLVILGIAAVAVSRIQGRIFHGQASVKQLQVGTPLMLECAEQVLAVRRFTENGYEAVNPASFNANLCGGVTVSLAGHSVPSVTLTDPYTGSGCPTDGICKLATISENGLTPLTIMLVDY